MEEQTWGDTTFEAVICGFKFMITSRKSNKRWCYRKRGYTEELCGMIGWDDNLRL